MASWQLRPITATVHRCSRLTTRSAIPQAERDQRLVSFHLLAVLPNHVVESTDRWATDGSVVSMMVVHVEPSVQGSGSRRL